MIGRALRSIIRAIDRARGNAICRSCGCTDHAACPDGCWWVETDLCSSCALDGLA